MATREEALLTRLVMDRDLHALERQIAEFNILEALGVVRHELRHSDFLAFLLDPAGKHGMGDYFLKRFLQAVILNSDDLGSREPAPYGKSEEGIAQGASMAMRVPVSPVELDAWSLDNAQVYRELYNIDVLVIDESHGFAVIIENKIDTTEHSGQLARYLDLVSSHFPRCKRVLGIYLTPDGSEPSLPQDYLSASYELLHDAIEELITTLASTLGPDLLTILRHYTAMLRRHIMSDSSIGELCRLLYTRHKVAFDLIYEHRLDRVATMADELKALVAQSDELILDKCDKTYIRFYPRTWNVLELRVAQGWTSSNMLLLFHLVNEVDRVRLVLYLGPSTNPLRERLFDLAQRRQPPFKPTSTRLVRWPILWEETIAQPSLYEEGSEDELLTSLKSSWVNFISNPANLPGLKAFVEAVLGELSGDPARGAIEGN